MKLNLNFVWVNISDRKIFDLETSQKIEKSYKEGTHDTITFNPKVKGLSSQDVIYRVAFQEKEGNQISDRTLFGDLRLEVPPEFVCQTTQE